MNRMITLLSTSLPAFVPATAIAQQSMPVQPGWAVPWHMWASSAWWIVPVLVLVVVTVATALGLGRLPGTSGAGEPREDATASALQILNERFARGEIGRPEYEERKRALLTIMTPGGQT